MRVAARIVRCAQRFHCDIRLRLKDRGTNARNILGILALCAVMGSAVEIEASGDDERDAIAAVESILRPDHRA